MRLLWAFFNLACVAFLVYMSFESKSEIGLMVVCVIGVTAGLYGFIVNIGLYFIQKERK